MKRNTIRRQGPRAAQPEMTRRHLTVTIERIVPAGMGIGHTEGLTVLVPRTTAGDVVRVAIDRMRGNTVFGSILELVESGPDRIDPPCPHFDYCGGCDFQHIPYEAQLSAKADIVSDCFRRIGGIQLDEIDLVPSPKEWAYRMRAEWVADPATPLLGYRKQGSREAFDVKTCPILETALEGLRTRLHDDLHNGQVDVEGEIQATTSGQAISVWPRIEGYAAGLLTMAIGEERYGFDATCFFQANAAILPELVEYVIAMATGGEDQIDGDAIDLYSGVGLFTLPLARRFNHVTGVESHAKAASYAHENAKAAGLENVTISGLKVDQWLRRKTSGIEAVRALVLDPPRAGAEPAVIEGIARVRPETLVYVSCDPATLARDVKALVAAGYSLANVRAFDMFPQTHHVETVATMLAATE